nr:FAD-binding oxidoreductase [Sandaracinus amylolyticus]
MKNDGLTLVRLEGRPMRVDRPAIEALASSMQGSLIEKDAPGYDAARQVWNAMVDRRPALIARCATPDDVVRCVEFARRNRALTSIRGGGHHIAGNALCEGGLTIDLSGMRGVRMTSGSTRVVVEAGATLADLDAMTQKRALAVPVGINSTTGVAGLTLGAGFGWISRKHGLTVDRLVSAEVVTASGDRVHASERENADLFWALRGGGGNFGVVTSFEFDAVPLGPEVIAGLIVHPLEHGDDVLDFYSRVTQSAPDELTVWAVLRGAPPLPFLPAEVHGKPSIILAVCWVGDPKDGEAVIAPLREHGRPYGVHVGPMPYVAWQQAFDPLLTPGARNYWKTHYFQALSRGLWDVLVDHAKRMPSPLCEVFVGQLGGAVARIPKDATAYAYRSVGYAMNVHTRWERAEDDARCIAWARSLFQGAAPFATGGGYLNFMPEDDMGRVSAAYGEHLPRLAQIKAKYDPENLFRVNVNITPAKTARREAAPPPRP